MILLFAAMSVAPAPLEQFGDWIVGCDNGRTCQAVALQALDLPLATNFVLARGPGSDDRPELFVEPNVDRKTYPVAITDLVTTVPLLERSGRRLAADTEAMLALLRQGKTLYLLDPASVTIGQVSTTGAREAIAWIDARQQRAGTSSAAGKSGLREGVPPAPALPLVSRPAPSFARPPELDRKALIARYGDGGCVPAVAPDGVVVSRLDDRSTLVLVPSCGGAYFTPFTALIADNAGRLSPAEFEQIEGGDREIELLPNAQWQTAERRLASFEKGRWSGDCGVKAEWVWDGAMFRLALLSRMDECAGSRAFITVWRADVR